MPTKTLRSAQDRFKRKTFLMKLVGDSCCLCTVFEVFIILFILLLMPPSALAQTYYVNSKNGSDTNPGISAEAPWKSLAKVNSSSFQPGDSILLKCGEAWQEDLTLNSDGSDTSPITVGKYGMGDPPVIRSITIYNDNAIVEDITVDHQKVAGNAARLRGAQGCVLRRLTLRNGTANGLDIARAVDLLVDACHIHHFLAGSFTDQQDAHGIVATRSQNITIRNTEVHHVSGDSFQADPERDTENLTNDILIENCHFWTGPLTEDFNDGWVKTDERPPDQRQYPGENAIDTKVVKTGWESVPRMRITVRNVCAHGWQKDAFIANKAAFNMKEKIEAVFDGITVYDCEIAFRLRGTRGNANVTIKNAVVYGCEKAIRAEDDLANLKVYNATFGASLDTQLEFSGGSGGKDTWDLRNNAFVNGKPDVASHPSNLIVSSGDLNATFVEAGTGDYRLKNGSQLIDAGETLSDNAVDRNGKPRSPPYDVGAYEYLADAANFSLVDAVVALKVLAGIDLSEVVQSDFVESDADVNGDSSIGLAEVLYVLQRVSDLRQ